ncbi:MAG TPA: hypothetical protein VLA09_06560, partial [Longimicrobiales bacterium]|nr:hypothetical protein [Longimicrobiales bacterium]
MIENVARLTTAIVICLCLPALAGAQMQSWKDVQVADIETMKGKFIGLAQEFDESQYDWRPMEGVRSVRDVLALAVVEAHVFPTNWGYDPPSGAAAGFREETERVGGFGQEAMIRELHSAFDHLIGVVRGMDEAKRMEASSYFGRQMPVHANIATAMADLH